MNKYLATRLYGGLHPTVIAAHIAVTSNIQKSPRKRGNGDVWLLCAVLLMLAALVVIW